MRLLTVLGTRPEIIRLSEIIRVLDQHCGHDLVHTGQNFQDELSGVFFRELGIREPDVQLDIAETNFATQAARILEAVDSVLERRRPDRVLVLGDTNSGLSAIVAARRGIPVYHLEAGNRCYDDRVPEEINRRIIDHCSAVLMPYTLRSKDNLVREGIPRDRIFVVGNPIFEVLERHAARIVPEQVLPRWQLEPGRYFLATVHRAENVDVPDRLAEIFRGFERVATRFASPVVVSVHPRTAQRLREVGIAPDERHVRLFKPLGFFEFVALERSARAVLTDSGTVQEECCIFRIPNVTLRDTTERPETVEVGSNILAGTSSELIERTVSLVLQRAPGWTPPPEYTLPHVAAAVAHVVLGLPGHALS